MRANHIFPCTMIAAAALVATACGTTSTGDTSTPIAAPPAATVMVVPDPSTIGAYNPAVTTVRAGQTVRWNFVDKNPHSVSADDGSFDSTRLSAGADYSFAFTAPGRHPYHCSIHPEMHGEVDVT